MNRTVETEVTISISTSQDHRYLEIEDKRSGIIILRVRLTFDEFGRIVSGQMHTPAEPADIVQSDDFGRHLVVGSCEAVIPDHKWGSEKPGWKAFLDALSARVASEGWTLRREERNHHRTRNVGGRSVQRFHLSRWNDDPEAVFEPPNSGAVIEVQP